METKFDKFLDKLYQNFENHASSIHNIEVQLGHSVNVVAIRAQEYLSSNIEVNPKEQVTTIIMRSGKKLEGPNEVQVKVKDDKVK